MVTRILTLRVKINFINWKLIENLMTVHSIMYNHASGLCMYHSYINYINFILFNDKRIFLQRQLTHELNNN